jgi:hypothetical protein
VGAIGGYRNESLRNRIKTKERTLFCNSYEAEKNPLRLDQRVITSTIEVHYESLGTSHEIYGHYVIVRSIKRNSLGHISLYREIEEAIRRAYSYGT